LSDELVFADGGLPGADVFGDELFDIMVRQDDESILGTCRLVAKTDIAKTE